MLFDGAFCSGAACCMHAPTLSAVAMLWLLLNKAAMLRSSMLSLLLSHGPISDVPPGLCLLSIEVH